MIPQAKFKGIAIHVAKSGYQNSIAGLCYERQLNYLVVSSFVVLAVVVSTTDC